jgi:hypothetical protein
MSRLFWPLALAGTFAGGLVAGIAIRQVQSAGQEQTVTRLQQQVVTLQERLHARESASGAAQPRGDAPASARHAMPGAARSADRFAAAAIVEDLAPLERPARSGGAPGPRPEGSAARGEGRPAPPPTVATALERFYQYLEALNGLEGRERWRRTRELIDELKGMGDVAGRALMQVLASGSDSDERRAAARLLGTLQTAEALPLLRDVIQREDDLLLRRAAAAGLRQLQTPESVPVMERMVADAGEDRFVRLSAAYGLAESGKATGVSGLAQIFDESIADGRGRAMAFRALASLNDERPLPFMRRLLTSDAEPSYRLQAIRYVTMQGDRQALGALQLVMQSGSEQPSIRDAAAQAYRAISGR